MSCGRYFTWTEMYKSQHSGQPVPQPQRWQSASAEVCNAWQPAPSSFWHTVGQAGVIAVPHSLQLNLSPKYSLFLGWSLIYSTREQKHSGGHSKEYLRGPHRDFCSLFKDSDMTKNNYGSDNICGWQDDDSCANSLAFTSLKLMQKFCWDRAITAVLLPLA